MGPLNEGPFLRNDPRCEAESALEINMSPEYKVNLSRLAAIYLIWQVLPPGHIECYLNW